MKALYFWIFLLITPLIASESWNAKSINGFSASATISKEKIMLPEAFVVELILTYPSGYHIDEKVLLANLLRNPRPGAAPFLLLSMKKENLDSQKDQGSEKSEINEKWIFHLEPQLAGKYGLTFLNIPFLPNATQERPVDVVSGILDIDVILPPSVDHSFLPMEAPLKLSNTFPIVLSPKMRASLQQKIADKEPSRNWARWKAKRFPWEIACILMALLGVALYYKYAPRKTPLKRVDLVSQIHYRIANEKLIALQEETEVDPSIAEGFIVELSNGVRSEIEEKYHLRVLPDTTEEFFAQLKRADLLDPDKLAKLTEFTKLADKVKFASHIPTLEECLAAKKAAKEIFQN